MNYILLFLKKVYNITFYSIAFFHVRYYLVLLKFMIPYRDVAISISDYNGRYGIFLRRAFYKKTLAQCGDGLVIGKNSYIAYRDTEIGNYVSIEEDCVISLCVIGDYSIVAHRVSIMSGGNHHDVDDLNSLFIQSNLPLKKIKIGFNVWIGVHSVVMADVSDHSVVGANAVVTKTFDNYSIIAGVPARVIRKRGRN